MNIDENFVFTVEDYAAEAVDRDKNTTIIKSAYYDTICKSLDIKRHQDELFKYIGIFRNRYINILSSPMITDIIPFNHSGKDAQVLFDACGVDPKEMQKVINEAKKVLKLDAVGKNANPFNVTMMMAIAHFYKDPQKRANLIFYFGMSFYYNMYSMAFKQFKPDPQVMQYTMDNMSYKQTLKKEGSLERAIVASLTNGVNHYEPQFMSLTDYNIISELIPGIMSRTRAMYKSALNDYMTNYKNNNKIFDVVERNEEGEFIMDRDTNIGRIEELANKYSLKFYSNPISQDLVNISAKMIEDVSPNELRTTIEFVHADDKSKSLKIFYQCLFKVFFEENPSAHPSDIQSIKFFATANTIYKRGNSKDASIIKIKDIADEWLKKGSRVYRSTSREATKNAYKKAVFFYFVQLVSSN